MSTEDAVRIVPARAADVDDVADLWVDLARGQRAYGSEIRGMANRTVVRESLARSAVTGELLLARVGDVGTDNDGGDDGGDGADDGRDGAGGDGHGDDLVGFVSFALDRGSFERERPRGIVTNLYVVPERRGEGIGSRLLDAAERALAELGAATITLEAMAENDRARAFYRNRGYAPHRVTYIRESATAGRDGGDERGERGDDGSEGATDGS